MISTKAAEGSRRMRNSSSLFQLHWIPCNFDKNHRSAAAGSGNLIRAIQTWSSRGTCNWESTCPRKGKGCCSWVCGLQDGGSKGCFLMKGDDEGRFQGEGDSN